MLCVHRAIAYNLSLAGVAQNILYKNDLAWDLDSNSGPSSLSDMVCSVQGSITPSGVSSVIASGKDGTVWTCRIFFRFCFIGIKFID